MPNREWARSTPYPRVVVAIVGNGQRVPIDPVDLFLNGSDQEGGRNSPGPTIVGTGSNLFSQTATLIKGSSRTLVDLTGDSVALGPIASVPLAPGTSVKKCRLRSTSFSTRTSRRSNRWLPRSFRRWKMQRTACGRKYTSTGSGGGHDFIFAINGRTGAA